MFFIANKLEQLEFKLDFFLFRNMQEKLEKFFSYIQSQYVEIWVQIITDLKILRVIYLISI